MRVKTELTFPGDLKEEPIICYLCKNFDITVSILEASFSTDTGWAILTFEGSDAEVKKAFDYLKHKNVKFEEVEKGD